MREPTKQEHLKSVRALLGYIRDHPTTPLSLNDLGRIIPVSPHHLHRLFHTLTATTPYDHQRRLRLHQAAWSLQITSLSVARIAAQVGYENHTAFSRAFKQQFSMTPSAFRETRSSRGARKPPPTLKIQLVKIAVSDFAKSTRFYREVLGLKEDLMVEAYGWAQYHAGNLPLCLYVPGLGGGDGRPGGDTGIHLMTDHLAATHHAMYKRGGRSIGPLTDSDDGGKFFLVKDPDGNILKITG